MHRFLCLVCLSTGMALGQNIDDVVIPRKTDIFITLERSVNTKTATPGEKFFGKVAVPVTIDDQIVLPVGTYVLGHVDSAKEAGRIKGKAQMTLKFDTIIMPDGRTRQIAAIVQSAEGQTVDPTQEDGTIEAGSGSQGGEAADGAVKGAVPGAAAGAAIGRSWKGVGIGSAVGAAGGAVIGLLKRGDDVVLHRGTTLTISLDDDIQFVKPRPRNTGTPLQP